MTENDDGPGVTTPEPVTTQITATAKQHDQPDRSAGVVTPVAIDRPCPDRHLWQYRVRDRGGHMHLHRGGAPRAEGHMRVAPCGEVYVIIENPT